MSTVEQMVQQAAQHLYEADLREENGWTKEEIKLLERLVYGKYVVEFCE